MFPFGVKANVLLAVADSSLGNNDKYSQNGHHVLAASPPDDDATICGACHVLDFRSGKSKRVASSTSHAETLALIAGVEQSLFLQTWLWEFTQPVASTHSLINTNVSELVPIVGITDCQDLLENLIKPALPTPVNRSMTLYLVALRELLSSGFVRAFVWADTRDNVSNCLTKLKSDGSLDLDSCFTSLRKTGAWEPKYPFGWLSTKLTDPVVTDFKPLPPPLPPTKRMQAKVQTKVEETDELPEK